VQRRHDGDQVEHAGGVLTTGRIPDTRDGTVAPDQPIVDPTISAICCVSAEVSRATTVVALPLRAD
jgi:hypothetical protein